MIRFVHLLPVVSFVIVAGTVAADCSTDGYETQLTAGSTPTLSTVLVGKSVDATGAENWKEIHCSPSGDLQKVGAGVGHATDPQKVVGTWTISGTGTNRIVTYDYGTGGSYGWTVWWDEDNSESGTSYCWENPSDNATIATGNTGSVPCI